MRNSGFVSIQSGIILLLAVLISGCGAAHSDVMLFGTNTKLALDISTPPETGGYPQLTLGYKRQEFVWMPLYVNGKDSKFIPKEDKSNTTIDSGKYVGEYVGEDGNEHKDTYSVLASFGAEPEAGPGKASAGLAQMFATGIAARLLAKNPSVTKLFTTQPDEGIDKAKVKEILKENLETKAKGEKLLAKFIDPKKTGKIDESQLEKLFEGNKNKEVWLKHFKDKSPKYFLDWIDEGGSSRADIYAKKAKKLGSGVGNYD